MQRMKKNVEHCTRKVLFFVATLLFVGPVFAQRAPTADILNLEDGSRVAATIQLAKSTDADVYVLVNGLIYATNRWDDVANGLTAHGATVIRYALPGQPENLRLLKKGEEPAFFETGLELDDMTHQLSMILKAAHITKKIHLVGLSYGASVAAEFAKENPDLVQETTFIAPLVVPTDSYSTNGMMVRAWLQSVRFWEETPCKLYGSFNPWLCVGQDYWYDQLYTQIYQSYLAERITTIPKDIDETIYKKAVFHLVRAVRDFDLKQEIVTLHHVSMLVGSEEDPQLALDQKAAFALVPEKERREFVTFQGAHHALPDEAPEQTVNMLLKIAGEQ